MNGRKSAVQLEGSAKIPLMSSCSGFVSQALARISKVPCLGAFCLSWLFVFGCGHSGRVLPDGGSTAESKACRALVAHQRVERRADAVRMERLESEIKRLHSDLGQAEAALIVAESRLAGAHTRAQAVRELAEARSLLEVAAKDAPWRSEEAELARRKIDESDEQLGEQHFGAAILLASRAKRIATDIAAEAQAVRSGQDVYQVRVEHANLRAGPSEDAEVVEVLPYGAPAFLEKTDGAWAMLRTVGGDVGWMYRPLLESFPPSPAPGDQ